MPRYTFQNGSDYFNTRLTSSSSLLTYDIKSTGPSHSKLESITITASNGKTAVAKWGNRGGTFELDGKVMQVWDLGKDEKIPGGLHGRRWNIGGKEWQSYYHKATRTWKVFSVRYETPDVTPVVVFRQHNSKELGEQKEPSVEVESSVSDDDFLVILLILLWSRHYRLWLKKDKVLGIFAWTMLYLCCCGVGISGV